MQLAARVPGSPGLLPVIAVSLVVHALALALLGVPAGAAPDAAGGERPDAVLHVYLTKATRVAGLAPEVAAAAQAAPEHAAPRDEHPAAGAPAPHAWPGFGERYWPVSTLDQRPQIKVRVEPEFPVLTLGPSGRVVLRLYINEKGSLDDVTVESADATGAFAKAAREAFAAARFTPGVKDGIAVKSLMRIEVSFGEPLPPPRGR